MADDSMAAVDSVAVSLASFVASLRPEHIPHEVSQRARHLMLDAIGCAFAARREPFAQAFSASQHALAGPGHGGQRGVMGYAARLPMRDAAMLNGVLMHGLDYDDTHMGGVVHLSVSVLPAVLSFSAQQGLSGQQMLCAYIAALEAGARIAAAVRGGFHQQGFHATGLVGTFAAALAVGKLMGQDAARLVYAQGAALSFASGSLQFIEDGAWTKRIHPGWSAQAGITAASLAGHGIVAPQMPYTGRYGLYRSYLGAEAAAGVDLGIATAGLDDPGHTSVWEVQNIAVKPFAMCHFVHAATDAAIALHGKGLAVADIADIEVLIPEAAVTLVCEPVERKRRPQNEYDAKFSLPYAVASGLMRGRLGLQDLLPGAYLDPAAQALMDKVRYRVDPDSTFPRHYSGEVCITLHDGSFLRQREAVNRGHADRPVTNVDVQAKFMDNTQLHFSAAHARQVCDMVLALDRLSLVTELETLVATEPQLA